MPKWTIRPATPEDGARAEGFLRTIPELAGTIEEGVERELWNWLFIRRRDEDNRRPTVRNVLFADDPAGRSIAHYGISELAYRINGRSVRAGMVCKLAVDEAYRREPVSMNLTVQLLHGYSAGGLRFAQGLANRRGLLEFHLAFGFKRIGNVPIFAKPVRLRRIAGAILPGWAFRAGAPFIWVAESAWRGWMRRRSATPRRAAGSVRVDRITRCDRASLTADPSSVLEGRYSYFADRSLASLQWRFFESPARDYRFYAIRGQRGCLGYFVLRPMGLRGFHSLAIVDLCFDFQDRAVSRAVFREIDRLALEENVDLCAMLVGSSEVEAMLRRELYLRSPESFTLVVHEPKNGVGVAQSKMKDWYVTWFDHDFV